MKIFIAGICGTFMAGIAQLARAGGYAVRGCDAGVYPPMSTLLRDQGIQVAEGYRPEHLGDDPGTLIIGNALSRGNPLVEHVLNEKLNFCSGPEWLREHILEQRRVIAVAGTHGKTTTSSILAWILECAGAAPGYLIGGKPGNFAQSASAGGGAGQYFVIEADEYDSAFFDKRAKFVHYRPHIAVLNNLEFDHADIYDHVAQIQKQFHHLLRTVPGDGWVVVNADDPRLAEVLAMGCWSKVVRFSTAAPAAPATPQEAGKGGQIEWRALPVSKDGSRFDVLHHGRKVVRVEWQCIGAHNLQNALAALATAQLAGVRAAEAGEYLRDYRPAARRLELLFESGGVCLYDDFAHHPTAIRHTIAALRARHPGRRVIAAVELRSNTMRLSATGGGHGGALTDALAQADCAIVSGGVGVGLPPALRGQSNAGGIVQLEGSDAIIAAIHAQLSGNDSIVIMSNGGFGALGEKIAASLATL